MEAEGFPTRIKHFHEKASLEHRSSYSVPIRVPINVPINCAFLCAIIVVIITILLLIPSWAKLGPNSNDPQLESSISKHSCLKRLCSSIVPHIVFLI